jgi:hypothetical protein
MKFTISTLLALAIAVPVTVVQAFPLEIAIESSINRGLMKVFPDGDYVKLQFYKGQDPQTIGYLHFKEPGMQRFDIVDDRKLGQKTQDQYNNVSLGRTENGPRVNEISVMSRCLRIRN